MKSKLIIFLFISAVFISAVSLAAALSVDNTAAGTNSTRAYAVVSTPPAQKESGGIYCLSEWNGYIAIFSSDTPSAPVYVTNITVSSLRSNDRSLLKRGIEVETLDAAAQLIEDFSG